MITERHIHVSPTRKVVVRPPEGGAWWYSPEDARRMAERLIQAAQQAERGEVPVYDYKAER